MFARLRRNEFIKSVSVLMTGALISQIINYAFSPILSRIYTVEEMADLNLYFRITGFIIGFATLRYEMSLPLPKNDSHSFLLYRASLKIALFIMAIVGLIGIAYIFVLPFSWFNFWFLLLVCIGSFFSVIINLGTYWSIRKKMFRIITQSRIINVSVANIIKLVFGFIKLGSIGLLIGTVIGYIAASYQFIQDYLKRKLHFQPNFSKNKQRVLLKEYKEFPLYNLPQSLSDLGRDLLIASLVVLLFNKETFGLYSYAIMVLNIPVAFIGVAIAQVFYNRASVDINEGKSIYPLVKKSLWTLLLLSIIPFGILYLFSEEVFVIAFGDQWRMAGVYAQVLVLYNFFNFLAAPLANLSLVLNKQKEFFILALINSTGQVAILVGTWYFQGKEMANFKDVLWYMTIFQSLMMLVTIYYYLRFSKLKTNS